MIESMPSNLNLVGIGLDDDVSGSSGSDVTKPKRSAWSREKDGPFGWVIVACAFLAFSLMAINSVSFGVFITELEVTFNLSRSMIGVIGACKLGLSTIAGLAGGPLVKKYGCRPICCLGILLAAVGHLAAAFSSNVWGILCTFGILAGAGAGLAFIPTVVIVQQHFVKKRALAAGIASSGVSGFAIAFSPLTRLLIDLLGWRGALIILAAVNVQMFVPAALFRPPRSDAKAKSQKSQKEVKKAPLPKPSALPDIIINGGIESKNGVSIKGVPSSPKVSRSTIVTKEKLLLPAEPEPEAEEVNKKCACAAACDCFDRSILSCSFILFLLTSCSIMYSMDAYYLRSTPRAITMGVDPVAASWLPSVIGIAGVVGRTMSGVVARVISPFSVNGLACVFAGLVVASSTLAPSVFGAHAAFCAGFGLMFGMNQGIQPTVVVSLLGVERLPLGMSWTLLMGGAGRVIANIVSGWLYDMTGGYTAPLLVSGGLLLIGGCSALLMAFILNRKKQSKQPGVPA